MRKGKDPDPLARGTDPGIRIGIRTKMSAPLTNGSGSGRPKGMMIRFRIQIPNTGKMTVFPSLLIFNGKN